MKSTLNHIESSLSSCVRLVRQLNSLLPKEERLEKFKLHPELEEDSDLEENADGERERERERERGREGERERERGREGVYVLCVFIIVNSDGVLCDT